MAKYLDWGGLLTLWIKIKNYVSGYSYITTTGSNNTNTVYIGQSNFIPVTGVIAGAGLNTTSNDSTTDGGTIGGSNNSGTIHLTKSGVTSGSYGPTDNVTPSAGASFSVPLVTVDKYGRVTEASTKTVTIPQAPSSFNITVTDDILDGTGGANSVKYAPYDSKQAGKLYSGTTAPTSSNRLNYDGYFYAKKLYTEGEEAVNLNGTLSLTNKTYNGYTLAAACAKSVDTSIGSSSSSNLPTTDAVKTYVSSLMSSVVGALVYKGVIASESVLLNTALTKGWYYIVNMPETTPATTNITIGGVECESGDMIIVNTAGTYTTSSGLGAAIDVILSNIAVITDAEINGLS